MRLSGILFVLVVAVTAHQMKVFAENVKAIADNNAFQDVGKASRIMDINEIIYKSDNKTVDPRIRRNNFGDLPVKCGPNQEKIDGECHDV